MLKSISDTRSKCGGVFAEELGEMLLESGKGAGAVVAMAEERDDVVGKHVGLGVADGREGGGEPGLESDLVGWRGHGGGRGGECRVRRGEDGGEQRQLSGREWWWGCLQAGRRWNTRAEHRAKRRGRG